ncbi:MAG: hypothetical protein GWN62_36890, partial [Aliifodinibius sp.]|nr:hypothetical protein [Fodinibius sp.]
MFSEIQQHFDALEDQRKNILSHLQHYDEEQLLFKPDSMKWSISQVVNHLILTEQSAVNYMNKKNKAERLPRLNWIAYLRIILLKIALVLPLKFKAPSEVVIPKSNRPLSELITEWEAVR